MNIRNIVRHAVMVCAAKALIQDLRSPVRVSFPISSFKASESSTLVCMMYQSEPGEVHRYSGTCMQERESQDEAGLGVDSRLPGRV